MEQRYISFSDAAHSLEKICEDVSTSDQIDAPLKELFKEARETLNSEVDRRISFMKYCEAQIDTAKQMRDSWTKRLTRFERALQVLKDDTMSTIKRNPSLPYKGALGFLKIQRNSLPTLSLNFLPEKKSIEIIDPIDNPLPPEYFETITFHVLRKDLLKEDLANGLKTDAASLVYGEHIRIKLG